MDGRNISWVGLSQLEQYVFLSAILHVKRWLNLSENFLQNHCSILQFFKLNENLRDSDFERQSWS